jgi:ketosteroid isomerase-like protein
VSESAIETLRAGYEAVSRGDWDALIRDAHPDFELVTADRVTSPGTYRGPQEARRFLQDLFEPFEEVIAEPEEFFHRGDRIAVFVHVRFRPKGSSAVVQNRIGHLWTVRDGKPMRLEIFPEREKTLEALRLAEAESSRPRR